MKRKLLAQRYLSILLIVTLLLACSPGTAFAAGDTVMTLEEYTQACETEAAHQKTLLKNAQEAAIQSYIFDENGYSGQFSRDAYGIVSDQLVYSLSNALDEACSNCISNAEAANSSGNSLAGLTTSAITDVSKDYITAEGMRTAIENEENSNKALTRAQINIEMSTYFGLIYSTNSNNYVDSSAVNTLVEKHIEKLNQYQYNGEDVNAARAAFEAEYAVFLAELDQYEKVESDAQGLYWDSLGNGLKYALNEETGELFIKGSGYLSSLPYRHDDYWKEQIKSVNIGKDIRMYYGFDNFSNTYPNLTAVNIDAEHSDYQSVDGVVFTKNKESLVYYPAQKSETAYKVPGSVLHIEPNAFFGCKNLQTVELAPYTATIGDRAFYNCTSLKDITLPEDLTSIGQRAFYNCRSLTSISIPENVASIGWEAFKNCRKLASVHIADNSKLQEISGRVFQNCYALQNIVLPQNLTGIGDEAFYHCRSLTNITIPQNVTTMGWYVFSDCPALETVTFADNCRVQEIGGYTFQGCHSLKTVALPEKLISIEYGLFSDCPMLQSINVPESVISIGGQAFENCSSLQSVNIPQGVTTIGDSAFSGCSSLEMVTFEEGSSLAEIPSGLFRGCDSLKNVNLPQSITAIGSEAFNGCTALSAVTLPEGLQHIGSAAFACTSITNVKIPAALSFMGSRAFEGCSSLEKVTFEDGCELQTLPAYVFQDCGNLQTVDFGKASKINRINMQAFNRCEKLTNVTILESITKVGKSAFANTAITSMKLPSSLEYMGANAFGGCSKLTEVTFAGDAKITTIPRSAFENCSTLCSVALPENVTRIRDYAFSGCESLTNINLPDSVAEIGRGAFGGCRSLQELNITAQLTKAGSYAFAYSGLKQVVFPAGASAEQQLLQIPRGLFCGCTELESVSVPEGIQSIGNRAFEGCTSLKSFRFPSTLTYLGARAFYGSGLTQAVLPEGISEDAIRPETFANSAVEQVSMPGTVREVGYGAFENCENLATLELRDPVSGTDSSKKGFLYVGNSAFYNCVKLTTTGLLEGALPDMGVEGIFTSIGHSAYANCASIQGELNLSWPFQIGAYAFSGCTGLTKVDLDAGKNTSVVENLETTEGAIAILPYGVFQNCTSLETVNLPKNLVQIENRAFEGCTVLKSIELPEGLYRLGARAFYGSGLESISLPEGITYIEPETFAGNNLKTINMPTVRGIGYSAFEGCKNLAEVDISKVPYIDYKAFQGCDSLKEVTIGDAAVDDMNHYDEPYLGEQSLEIPNLRVVFEGKLPYMNNPFDSTAKILVHCDKCDDVSQLNMYNNVFTAHIFVESSCSHCGAKLDEIEPIGTENLVRYPLDKVKQQYLTFNKDTGMIVDVSYYKEPVTSITVPKQIDGVAVTGIGDGAFRNNPDLEQVILSEGIETIGRNAFTDTSITSLTLPKTVTRIAGNAFNGSSLQSLKLPLSASFTKGFKLAGLTKFTFTEGLESAYDYDTSEYKLTPWYKNRSKELSISFEEGVSRIGDYTFANQRVEKYVLPASLKEIGNNAFYRNAKLNDVTMQEGVERIGYEAFAECELLAKITLPCTLVSMKYNSFAGDEELVATVYPDSYAKKAAAKYGITYKVDKDGPVVQPEEKPDISGIGQIEAGKIHGKIGSATMIKVPIEMNVNPGIVSLNLGLAFDRNALELVKVENGEIFDDDPVVDVEHIGETKALVWSNSLSDANITKTGKLANLYFKVKASAVNGEYPITLTCDYDNAGAVNKNMTSIRFDVKNGAVTAQNYIYGDVTGDDNVNNNDVAYLIRNIAQWTAYSTINKDAADLDLSGTLNLTDAMILERHLAGWDEYTSIPMI